MKKRAVLGIIKKKATVYNKESQQMVCDILFENAKVYNSAYRRFFDGYLALRGQYIVCTGQGEAPESLQAAQRVDLGGRAIVPGLIDSHMHIESSSLTPMAYANEAVRHGVTTIVSEPHEIANVAGVAGIDAMMAAGKGAPIDIYYGIPSSVPSTNDKLETAGGSIDEQQVLQLLQREGIICLGEVMNTRSVLTEPDGKANRLIRAFRAAAPKLPVEGHVPRIVGTELAEYMLSGVDSDHTEHTLEELKDRWFFGFFVQLQEKTLKREVVEYLAQHPELLDSTALVTDDVMADEMVHRGILDDVLRLALELGMPMEHAVYCAATTPAKRMRLYDRGQLRPGYLADFVILEKETEFTVFATYKSGRCVYTMGDAYQPLPEVQWPAALLNSVKLQPLYESDFVIRTEREGIVSCRTALVDPHRTQTQEVERKLEATDGELHFEGSGVNQYAVFERYGINGNRGQGLVDGCTIRSGAVATTYSHDSHNLCVLGTNKADMAAAANTVIAMKGGIAVVDGGSVIATARMPIGGILSDKAAHEFAVEMGAVTEAMKARGYDHDDPIMSLCVLALPVSPALKFSDFGIVDVTKQQLVSLEK